MTIECSRSVHSIVLQESISCETKMLCEGLHCGGDVLCRRSNPLQAENPANRILSKKRKREKT